MGKRIAMAVATSVPFVAVAATVDGPRYGKWGLDLASMDRSVAAGDDFFRFVNGTWLRKTPIPADKATISFDVSLRDQASLDVLRLARMAVAHPDTPGKARIAAFYIAWMDTEGIDRRGLASADRFLKRIAAVRDRSGLVQVLLSPGYAGPFAFWLDGDKHDSTRNVLEVAQGSLGMPNREDYLAVNSPNKTAYRDYIALVLRLAGRSISPERVDAIVRLETELARAQWSGEQERDSKATDNPARIDDLDRLFPDLGLKEALAGQGLPRDEPLNIDEPDYVKAVGGLVAKTSLEDWKDLLTFRFLSDHADYLPRPFGDAHFQFYDNRLGGVKVQSPRWKRGGAQLNRALGDEVGQLYIKAHWTSETSQRAAELIEDLRAAYAQMISEASWMDEATRAEALAKISNLDARVGFPKHFTDYSKLRLSARDALGNAMAAAAFERSEYVRRANEPANRDDWGMRPQTVNAYNDSTSNQITFPAAILQPPYLDARADPAVNYGGAGATIGHEIGHAFDDQGRRYDAHGALRDWWTKSAAAAYQVKADQLVAQFNKYEPLPGQHLNGSLTLGENIGDLSGLEAAYVAYQRYLKRHGGGRIVDNLTPDQRFFMAYAQSWRGKSRDETVRFQLITSSHSPFAYRVNGVVRNMDAWYKAFDVRPTAKLYLAPKDRVHIWKQ